MCGEAERGVCDECGCGRGNLGDVGSSSLRNAKGLTSACGPGRSLLSWRDHLARLRFGRLASTTHRTKAGAEHYSVMKGDGWTGNVLYSATRLSLDLSKVKQGVVSI
jgi:hypothetical protein